MADEELAQAEAVLDGLGDVKRFVLNCEVVLTKAQVDFIEQAACATYNTNSHSIKTASVEVLGIEATKWHCERPVVIVRRLAAPVANGFKGRALGDVHYCSICGSPV